MTFFSSILLTFTILILNSFLRAEERVQNADWFYDSVREDDYDDFELSDIIALAETTEDWSEDRALPEERMLTVHDHNSLRKNFTYPVHETSDMIMVEYNNTLEWTAMLMVEMCVWGHVFGELDNMTQTEDEGQCLYNGPQKRVFRGINLMYEKEINWYFWNNFTCMEPWPKYQCGHILQILMGRSEHIGFNRRYCFPRKKNYLTCWHYYPGVVESGYKGELYDFNIGIPCSNCKPGYSCSANLCIPEPERYCKVYDLDCECKRICYNCGSTDLKNCKCICKMGWDYNDCSFPCKDKFPERPGKRVDECEYFWPYCGKHRYKNILCRKYCKTCPKLNWKKRNEFCCGGIICEEFHVLNIETCECEIMCPSIICKYGLLPTTTTTTTTTTSTSTTTTTTTTSTAIQTVPPQPKLTKQEPRSTSKAISTKQPIPEKEPQPSSKGSLVITSIRMFFISLYITYF